MRFPEQFYVLEAKSGRCYTHTPTAIFDIQQMLNGNPCWVLPTLPREKIQKKLILSDWTARHWSNEKSMIVKQTFMELLNERFSLYIWSANKLVPITKENLEQSFEELSCSDIHPAYPKEIYTVASEQKIARDHIYLLDDYQIECLCKPDEITLPRTLNLSYLRCFKESVREKAMDILLKTSPPLTKLIHDKFDKDNNELACLFKIKYPEIKIDTQYHTITVDRQLFDWFLSDQRKEEAAPPFLQSGCILTINQLASAEVFCCADEGEGDYRFPKNLSNLKQIGLFVENIGDAGLTSLFNAAPNLENIFMSGSNMVTGMYQFSQPMLNLKDIDFHKMNISDAGLTSLFTAAPKLERVKLYDFEKLTKDYRFPKPMPNLKEITLRSIGISDASLASLFIEASNLEIVDIAYCKKLTEDYRFLEDMPNLKEINLNDTNISDAGLASLFTAAPNLERLTLDDCKKLTKDYRFPKQMPNLKEIDLNDTNISEAGLASLLIAAPNLERVTLDDCKKLTEDYRCLTYIPNLKEIKLSNTYISDAGLSSFFTLAPNLEKVFLNECGKLTKDYRFPKQMPHLKEIDLRSTSISDAGLIHLFIAASNLEIVVISYCKKLTEDYRFLEDMPNLKEIYLNNTNISDVGLASLFTAAPNLESVYLDDCKKLTKDYRFLTYMPKLRIIYFSDTNISDAGFDSLCAVAPNLEKGRRGYHPRQQSLSIPAEPRNTHEGMSDFKPEKKPFKFTGRHNDRNHKMILEKFSQYLTLTQQHLDVIPKIQDGICSALSFFFKDQNAGSWGEFLDTIGTWDGSKDKITEDLKKCFEQLYPYINNHQLKSDGISNYFLGDSLGDYLKKMPINHCAILTNPWHAIAIRKNIDGYQMYNPNSTEVKKTPSHEWLTERIVYAMGALVHVETNEAIVEKPEIRDWSDFVKQGGLLSLHYCENDDELLSQKPEKLQYSKQSLEQGLLVRNTMGVPAWIVGIINAHTAIKQLTLDLIEQYEAIEPRFSELLEKSMVDISPEKQHELVTKLIQLRSKEEQIKLSTESEPEPESESASAFLSPQHWNLFCKMIRSSNKSYYEDQLKIWAPTQHHADTTPLKFCQHLVSVLSDSGEKTEKKLIDCSSTDVLDALSGELQIYCANIRRPMYYIDKPEDLVCSAPYVYREKEIGVFKRGPAGPLHDFLSKNKELSPVIIINYEHFKADDIVRFNGLLDENPHADGTALPQQTVVIGLTNTTHPDYYNGADFSSRFDEHLQCQLRANAKPVLKAIPTILETILDDDKHNKKTIINLFHASDWKARLLGRWAINEQTLRYEEGELQKAIDANLPIEIKNGLWEDDSFVRFWQQIRLGGIYYADKLYRIPDTISIVQSEGYDWNGWHVLKQYGISIRDIPVLNEGTLSSFFNRYEVDNACHSIVSKPGILHSASTAALEVNLTSTLSDNAWAMLLSECKKLAMILKIHCAPGVVLPAQLPITEVTAQEEAHEMQSIRALHVIPSADIDLTVAQITAEAEWIVIDVSECQPHDLMGCVDGRFDSETLTFSFIERVGFLKEALMDGKSILLKGHFSRELVDHLAPLLIKIDKNPAFLGRLIIVPEDALPFSFVHTTSMDDTSNKWLFLGKISEDIREKIAPYIEIGREPLSILQARVSYLTINPDGDSNLAWQGMEALDHSVHIPDALLDVHQSAEQARLFTEVRINRVKRQLKQGPVFLSGLSGVGKTTFIQKELCSVGSGYELFEGEANIKNWIESGSSDTIQLLFLDEANLSQRQWSEFEGLFQTPPALFINGIHYPVSKNHQVVFAGNPISYGDERKLAPFFLRHGGAVLFEPLSKAVMYEKILKPILNDQGIDETSIEMVSNIILDAYVLIAECSTKELLISPRELEMMALLTLCKYKKNKGVSLDESAKAAVYELGLSLIPKQHVSAQESFIAKFKPEEMSIALASTELADQDFLITPSRQCIVQQIQERLELHLWRKSTIHQLNETQLYGGLGGILITGEPGEGKSVLVVAALVRAGLQEKKPTHLTTATSDNGIFYRMPVSMGLSEKKALLIQAWNEGAIVIIDEINTSPMMEQYLNALLMGRHPETGQRPQNPGFMVIGTQNSMSSAGRRAASTALLRRVTSVTVTPYQPDEMKDILIQKGIESTEADDMVEAYIKQREHAIINHLSPLPCFRDLLRIHPIKSTYKTTKMGSNQGPSPQGDFSRILEQEVEEKRPVKTDEFTAISVIPNDDIDTTDMTLESEPIGRGNKTQTHQGQTDRVGLFKAKPPEKKIEGPQEPERDTHFSKK